MLVVPGPYIRIKNWLKLANHMAQEEDKEKSLLLLSLALKESWAIKDTVSKDHFQPNQVWCAQKRKSHAICETWLMSDSI